MKHVASYAPAFAAGLLGFAVGGWQAGNHSQAWRLRLEEAESRLAHFQKERAAERLRQESELATLRSALSEARISREETQSPTPQGPGEQSLSFQSTDSSAPSRALRELLAKPRLAGLELEYGRLFERFGLSPGDREEFKRLLAERVSLEETFGLGAELSPADQEAALNRTQAALDASDRKIRTFLNNEQDYLAYKRWEASKPEHPVLTGVLATGEPLGHAQEDALLDLMVVARERERLEPFAAGSNASRQPSSPDIQRFLGDFDRSSEQLLKEAAAFLSAKQLAALRTIRQQQRAQHEVGLKMLSLAPR
jgi:hypothetical protein